MAIAGVGAIFKRGDGTSSETFTAIAEINNITGPGMTREFIDTTALDTAGGYRTFITGFRDGGDMVLEMNFTIDSYGAMLADFESDDTVNYQLVLPDTGATTFDFAALVTGLPMTVPPDDKVTMTVTLKISGAVVMSS